jgi:hypothetical protein
MEGFSSIDQLSNSGRRHCDDHSLYRAIGLVTIEVDLSL